jgi:hypothetical protein
MLQRHWTNIDVQRRRKQLRLAQQAYRKRKETTIGNLQSRVQELETGIEDLSHSFLSFSNLLLEERLLSQYPQIASALQTITQQCVSLAKAGSDEPSEALVRAKESSIKSAASPDNKRTSNLVLEKAPSETSTDVEDIVRSAATKWPGPPTPPYQDQSFLPFGIVMSPSETQYPYITPPLSLSPQSQNLLPSSLVEDTQLTIAQRIVQACCQNGYRLLVDTPNSPRVQQIFGSMLDVSERNRMISGFYAGTQDKFGDRLELKANVLTALRANINIFTEDQLQLTSRIWQIALESNTGEWMDSTGVQKYLRDKRLVVETFNEFSGRTDSQVSPSLDMSSFIKREFCEFGCHDALTNVL